MSPKNKSTDQEELPGMAQPKIAAIERAAKAYRKTISERLEIQVAERNKKAKLKELMHEHVAPTEVDGVLKRIYRRADVEVICAVSESVKVNLDDEIDGDADQVDVNELADAEEGDA
jgi:hypothetical protein